ncbi:hypothetical protein D9M71_616830 [compost metagenome]
MDHIDHAIDLLAVLGQALDHLGGLLHPGGQPGNRSLHAHDHFLAAAGQGVGRLRQVAGGTRMLGNVVDGGGHFIDGRRRLIGFALLAQHAVTHFIHARCQACGAVVQLSDRAGDGADHTLVTGLHGVECVGHLSDFVAAGQRHTGRQVAGFFNVKHHILQGVELTEQKTDQQL